MSRAKYGSDYSIIGLDWLYLRLLRISQEKWTQRAFGDCDGRAVLLVCVNCICHYRREKVIISNH